jgi:hypothetical protein
MPLSLALFNENGGLINVRKPRNNPFLRAASEFKKIKKELQHPRLRRAQSSLETFAAACVADNFARMEDKSGTSWPPLASSTIEIKNYRSQAGGGNFRSGGKLKVDLGRDKKGRFNRVESIEKGAPRRRQFPTRDAEGEVTGTRRRSVRDSVSGALAKRQSIDERKGIKQTTDWGWGGRREGVSHGRQMRTDIAANEFLPLVDTGALYQSVAMPFNRTATSAMASGSTGTPNPFNQKSSPIAIDLRNKQISIVPKSFGKDMQKKFKLHNRSVSDGVILPGREFFYLKQADMTLIGDVLVALAAIDDRERAEYYWPGQPKKGTYFKTTYASKSKAIKATAPAVKSYNRPQKKPFSTWMNKAIAKNGRAEGIVASKTNPIAWIDELTKKRMSETGVFEFATGVASIGAMQRHLNKRKGRR